MTESCGSFPYGKGAPAGVITTPAFFAFATTFFAHPSSVSYVMKYPPFGLYQLPAPSPFNSLSNVFRIISNFGRRESACLRICSVIPWISLKKRTWRSWFTLSWPMVWIFNCFLISSKLLAEVAIAATPEPGNVILLVEQNL